MDYILLKNIRVRTCIGVPDDERKNAQDILVTVELLHPLQKTGASDDIENGIDYATVTEEVMTLAKTERKTIERFAEDIASAILQKFKPQGGVCITVAKKPLLPLESASVTIQRP